MPAVSKKLGMSSTRLVTLNVRDQAINDDRSPMNHVMGGSLPAAIWREFVAAGTRELHRQPQPGPEATETPLPDISENPTSPQCDVRACAAAFASFRASDCTYQPYSGQRRLCDLRPNITAALPRIARAAAATGGSCNADMCAGRFRSFDPVSCTYQPYGGGPRALCDVGQSN